MSELPTAEQITIRTARPVDGPALVRIHAEVARYYVELAPDIFQMPALQRFAGELDEQVIDLAHRTRYLVAEARGEVVGALVARLLAPEDQPDRALTPDVAQLTADNAQLRLRIEYLATSAGYRRQRVGTRLVEAAEAWGRACGATIAETTTFQGSPLSVPFWEDRMGYEERSINLRKPL
jgi:GNAT superfamily N-acetyltransferase